MEPLLSQVHCRMDATSFDEICKRFHRDRYFAMSEQQAYNAGDANQVAKAQGKARIREHLRKTGSKKS